MPIPVTQPWSLFPEVHGPGPAPSCGASATSGLLSDIDAAQALGVRVLGGAVGFRGPADLVGLGLHRLHRLGERLDTVLLHRVEEHAKRLTEDAVGVGGHADLARGLHSLLQLLHHPVELARMRVEVGADLEATLWHDYPQ